MRARPQARRIGSRSVSRTRRRVGDHHRQTGSAHARSALFDPFEDPLGARGGQAPIAVLLRLLTPLGIAAPAVRTAVPRMVRQGWLSRCPCRPDPGTASPAAGPSASGRPARGSTESGHRSGTAGTCSSWSRAVPRQPRTGPGRACLPRVWPAGRGDLAGSAPVRPGRRAAGRGGHRQRQLRRPGCPRTAPTQPDWSAAAGIWLPWGRRTLPGWTPPARSSGRTRARPTSRTGGPRSPSAASSSTSGEALVHRSRTAQGAACAVVAHRPNGGVLRPACRASAAGSRRAPRRLPGRLAVTAGRCRALRSRHGQAGPPPRAWHPAR